MKDKETTVKWSENVLPKFPFQPYILSLIEEKNHDYEPYDLKTQLENEFLEWSCEVQKLSDNLKSKTISRSIYILERLIKNEDDDTERKELYISYKAKVKSLEAITNVSKPTLETIYGDDIEKLNSAYRIFYKNKFINCRPEDWLYWLGGVWCYAPKQIEWLFKGKSSLVLFIKTLCPEFLNSSDGVRKNKEANQIFSVSINGKISKIDSNDRQSTDLKTFLAIDSAFQLV